MQQHRCAEDDQQAACSDRWSLGAALHRQAIGLSCGSLAGLWGKNSKHRPYKICPAPNPPRAMSQDPPQRAALNTPGVSQHLKLFFFPIVDAMRSTSIALVPYLIALATLILANELSINQIIDSSYASKLTVIRLLLWEIYPVVFMLFFAAQYASYASVNRIVGGSLCLISVVFYNAFVYGIGWEGFSKSSLIQVLLIPIVNVQLIKFFHGKIQQNHFSKARESLSQEVTDAFTLIVPFILTIAASIAIMLASDPFFTWIKDSTYTVIYGLGNDVFLFIRMIFIHAFWSIGLHGVNTFDLLMNSNLLSSVLVTISGTQTASDAPNQFIDLNFYNLFVLHGGAGSVLALCIALAFASADGHAKKIGAISFPFVIFNISEILIFGLPIIFNRILLIPFFMVPIVNYVIAHLVYLTGALNYSHMTPSWTTPIFINSYLAGGGHWLGPALQLVQLVLGTVIYWHFVKRYTQVQSSSKNIQRLMNTLNLPDEIRKMGDQGFYKAQKKIIKAHTEVSDVISILEKNKLELFYQPKVHARIQTAHRFEALLRIRMSETEVRGPFFLSTLEDASFASAIDLWVCDAVKRDIDRWRALGLNAEISINLHPDTVSNPTIVQLIAKNLSGYPVDFEIIERGDVSNEAVVQNIHHLRDRGFKIALDDFGSGYSGFGVINALPLDILKIDKSLLDATDKAAGQQVFEACVRLCQELHITSVVEGVETQAQMNYAVQSGVDYIQGYFTGRPMPSDAVEDKLKSQAHSADHAS
jgi:lactose/cellobiose-specific phosphotransferase system IIC component